MVANRVKLWLLFAIITAIFWGIWGAFIEIPERAGFPATLGYAVWAVTMIPGGIYAIVRLKGKPETDSRSIFLGLVTGLLGCAGQLVLFQALKTGPAYLVFPFVSLAPVITILMSVIILKERASRRAWTGIFIALLAIFLLSYQPSENSPVSGYLWVFLSLLVALMWGIQAYILKAANITMQAESLILYTTLTALALIPAAIWMTDFTQNINWGFKGPYLAAMIQILNAIGFICLVYAFRFGKAIFISPMVNAVPPVITVIISLTMYQIIPHPIIIAGMVLAVLAALLLAIGPD